MAQARTYPQGVTSWVDTTAPDPQAAAAFYESLFGWTTTEAMPPGAPGSYLIATLDGQDVAAIAPADGPTASWNTYVAVDDADSTAAAVTRAGGTVLSPPADAGPGGRTAHCADPLGAEFHLWQARRRLGAQLVNAPNTWNFSDLHTPDRAAAMAFYRPVFGWVDADMDSGAGVMLQVPGYGDHLAATSDPGIRERQASAPPGFGDVIGSLVVSDTAGAGTDSGDSPNGGNRAEWRVTFTVDNRDAAAALAERLGATVLESADGLWTRTARLRDPQGATFTISQFTPPSGDW